MKPRLDAASWVVLAGVSAALHVGKLSPAVPVLRETLGITLLQAGFLLSTVQLAGMALGLLVGLLVDGWGLRRSLLWGLALLSAASMAGAFARDASALLLLRGVEGLGFLMVAMPAPGLIRRLVQPERLSITLGLWGTYMPTGAALALLLGPLCMAWVGWPGWWLGLGLLSAACALWILQVVPPDAKSEVAAHQDARAHQLTSKPTPTPTHKPTLQATNTKIHVLSTLKQRLQRTLRTGGPWWVALSFACYSSQWLAVVGFLPTMVAQAGLPIGAAVCTALVAGVNGLGNLASGRLLARGWAAPRLLQMGFVSMAFGALVAFAPWTLGNAPWAVDAAWVLRLCGVLVFSMVGGLIPGTLFSLAVRLAPDETTVSTTVGWMQQLSAAGQFAGPPLVAWVAAQHGDWSLTWSVTGLVCVVGVGLSFAVTRTLRVQQVVQP